MRRREFIKSALGSAVLWKAHALLGLRSLPGHDPDPKSSAYGDVQVPLRRGFYRHSDAAVVHRYFAEYFPRAIDLAAQLRESGNYRYVWTTGSWLLYEYLEQATAAERARMEKAISQGDIAWHALPFTWQTEMMDESMIAGAIGLSQTWIGVSGGQPPAPR